MLFSLLFSLNESYGFALVMIDEISRLSRDADAATGFAMPSHKPKSRQRRVIIVINIGGSQAMTRQRRQREAGVHVMPADADESAGDFALY